MEEILKLILTKIEVLGERMEAHDRSNKEEFRKLDKKIDDITVVVAQNMEEVSGLKSQMEKQDIELKVLKGGK